MTACEVGADNNGETPSPGGSVCLSLSLFLSHQVLLQGSFRWRLEGGSKDYGGIGGGG